MGTIKKLFESREEKILKTCLELYNKAKKTRPDKSEYDCFKIVMITKPPFDYQADLVLDELLSSCKSINDLASIISEYSKLSSEFWKSREKNKKSRIFEERNKKFFEEFWFGNYKHLKNKKSELKVTESQAEKIKNKYDDILRTIDNISEDLFSVFSEIDFYIKEGYFKDAEKLIGQLSESYPENIDLLSKIKNLEEAKSKNQLVQNEPDERKSAIMNAHNKIEDETYINIVTITEIQAEKIKNKYKEIQKTVGEPHYVLTKGYTCDPHHLGSFDVNQFLKIYEHIKIKDGYVLDYLYLFNAYYGGKPLLYSRRKDESFLTSLEEYYKKFKVPKRSCLGNDPTTESSKPYLSFITVPDNPIAYFEFAFFLLTVHRFYYYGRVFIFTKKELNKFIDNENYETLDESELKTLNNLDICPQVILYKNHIVVRMFCFEINTGYAFLNVKITKPNILVDIYSETIIKSKTQICF